MIATGTKSKHLLFNSLVPEGWEVKTVDQIKANEKYACCAGPFGSSISAKFFVDEGIPVIRGNNLTICGETFIDNGFVFVSEDKARSFPGQHVRAGDLIFTCWGTLGQVGLIPDHSNFEEYIISNKQLKLRVNSEVCNSKFLYYYFSLPQMVRHINDIAIGSAVPGINLGLLKSIKIVLPPKETQGQIVALISSISNLIENNKRRITLLENMAEEIYREWFVRFRFPGWQEAEFEKGQPIDWPLIPVADAIEINPKERVDKGEDKPFVGMEALSTDSMYFETGEWRTGSSGSKFRNGDALFPRITPCLENGKRGFTMSLDEGQVAVGSTEFIVMRGKLVSPEYTYLLCSFPAFRTHAEQSMVGASGRQRVAENCFSFFLIRVPPVEIMDRFTKLIRPMFNEIGVLNRHNAVLEKTKNQLLPRLISGKLSVENLDIQFPPSMRSDEADAPAA